MEPVENSQFLRVVTAIILILSLNNCPRAVGQDNKSSTTIISNPATPHVVDNSANISITNNTTTTSTTKNDTKSTPSPIISILDFEDDSDFAPADPIIQTEASSSSTTEAPKVSTEAVVQASTATSTITSTTVSSQEVKEKINAAASIENLQVSTEKPVETSSIKGPEISSPAAEEAEEVVEWDGPIRKCNHKNTQALNKCLRLILEDLKPRLSEGIPEINLPPMDPLHISNLAFSHGSGPVKIVATFMNVEVRGLSTFNRSDFGLDQVKKTLDFDLYVPMMQIVGDYELSGNLFFFPVGGTGTFWLNLVGVAAGGSGALGVVENEVGKKTVVVKRTDLDLDIGSIKLHLTNLFNGDRILGTVINNFLNENGKDIFEEVKPQIGQQVGEMVSILTNKALSSLSADHFADVEDETDLFG